MTDKEFAGSALYGQWINPAGTLVFSVESRNFSYNSSIETIDATAGSDATRRKLGSFKDATAALSMTAQSDGTALIAACAPGTRGTLIFGEAGTATGSPKVTQPAMVTAFNRAVPYADVVTYDISWESTGDPTFGAY